MNLDPRRIGDSDLMASPLALGLWPISGVTSLGVTDASSIATIQQARQCGINHFDSAYSYGLNGESDRILRTALEGDYSGVIVASKVGMYYDATGTRQLDSRPETLRRHCHEILERLGTHQLDILYLHCVDGSTPIEESAECLADLQAEGLARYLAISNIDVDQLTRFASVVKPIAVQLPLNMLQQETYQSMLPYLEQHRLSYVAYWVLMKGLLAGAMSRDHKLAENDRRRTYEIYNGQAWNKAQDLIDRLRGISDRCGWSVARLVVAWTLAQPHVGAVICGAKTPAQIIETAQAATDPMPAEILALIEAALAEHFA
jgi:aryl-alcohol dehydrogenase-like predicted oxidoreductase